MKTLIVEDDLTSRVLMQELLRSYGPIELAVNGPQAVDAFRAAIVSGEPFDLVCLDIMLPGIDGHQVLSEIRAEEEAMGIFSTDGVKILMTTALGDMQNKINAFSGLCDAYLMKPIFKEQLMTELKKFNLIP